SPKGAEMQTRLLVAAAIVISASAAGVAQTNGTPERFTAMAVNMARGGAGTVEIVVNRWSTEAEREKLMATLLAKGPEKLLDVLEERPRVGYFRTPTSIGYDVHFAHRVLLRDGGERIVLATNRRIGFWEAANRPRSIDYPFTVVELRINRDGV